MHQNETTSVSRNTLNTVALVESRVKCPICWVAEQNRGEGSCNDK